jgi:hypothetical protein
MRMNKRLMALSAGLLVTCIAAGPSGPPSNSAQMASLAFLVGSWQCTTSFLTSGAPSGKRATATGTMVVSNQGAHWLHGTETMSMGGKTTEPGDVFFGYHARLHQWVMIEIDPLGYSAVETSLSPALNGSTWTIAYPGRNGFKGTLRTDSSMQYTMDSSWQSHKGKLITSHESCTKH